jgi:brefeldin A-inhibited guanine nucleotide-exchange protein
LEAQDVARFLHLHQDRLDKTAVGELLGREKEWLGGLAAQILHAYAFELDFCATPLDEAIRHFLAGFRLPGEAQKIDRMMEKFAERFCLQNPEDFPSADTAFVLAFRWPKKKRKHLSGCNHVCWFRRLVFSAGIHLF